MPNLLLHSGADAVPRSLLPAVPTPRATRTWQPIPHERLVHEVERQLPKYNLSVVSDVHALTHDQSRYFGLMEVRNGSSHPDYTWVLGLRNSHDKTLPAGLVAGSQFLVCDNLAFSGEITVSRKHTRHLLHDLPVLIGHAIEQLVSRWHDQDRRIATYKACGLSDTEANDLLIQALDRGVLPASRIPKVLEEWRRPSHGAFESRDTWSLFNAFTESLKGQLHLLPARTQALHGLCDEFVGLN